VERAALAADEEKAGDRTGEERARGEEKVLERVNSLDLVALREAMMMAQSEMHTRERKRECVCDVFLGRKKGRGVW
jgi:hypothetical protein